MMNKKAFTLIELLVVVLIIGILAAIALPQYQKAVIKSRFSEAVTNTRSLMNAAEVCEMENGKVVDSTSICANLNNLAVSVGNPFGNCSETEHFFYCFDTAANMEYGILTTSKDYEICLCGRNGRITAGLGDGSCSSGVMPPSNIFSLLNLPNEDCECC